MGLRAMFSAISGLQSHSTWLDVIGNNISNVNTVAYKASRVTFSDAISQTTSSGSAPSTANGLGGVNPQQVGLGSRVSSIQTLFNPGPILQTGNATDVALKGEGFLVIQKGNSTLYSRAGNLTFDGNGYLVDANGGLVQGFQARIQYSTRDFNSDSSTLLGPGASNPTLTGNPARITDASLVLDTTNMSAIGNIQITRGMTLPARATQTMTFKGNLDSFLQATDTARGGCVILGDAAGNDNLPIGAAIELMPGMAMFNTDKIDLNTTTGQYYFEQFSDFTTRYPAVTTGDPSPLITGGASLTDIQNSGNNFVWDTGLIPPAHTMSQTVYDSLGNPREITILLYQVNDLGDAGYNSAAGPSQVAYAWYAFETTGGVAPATSNLLGGTAIIEGDNGDPNYPGFDRNIGTGTTQFSGDLLYFNTDGSLASRGATQFDIAAGTAIQADAYVYLPAINFQDPAAGVASEPVSPLPTIGAEVMAVRLDFGTNGVLGVGRRDGLYSDAAGSYQVINGVNTYIPNHTAYCSGQDGYPEGQLTGVAFDQTGILKGTFATAAGDQIVDLAQIVLARVDNPEGMNKVGNGYFAASNNSGSVYVGLAGRNGLGTVEGYALEGSNVDLTVELSNLIIAQRGFEVNARSISTTNETLNTLVNLGR